MRNVLLIFIDGLGLGDANPEVNPLVRFDPEFFRRLIGQPLTIEASPFLSDAVCLVPADATLGVEGLPQSATGQTALFTGVNAPQKMGRHILGFPGPELAKIISRHGIMMELVNEGYSVTSANMYGPSYLELVAKRKRRHSVTTLTILGAGQRLRSVEDLSAGEAVYQDITNESLPGYGLEGVLSVSPVVAGERLANLAARHRFTMFEYFQTDWKGHKKDWVCAETITKVLAEFLDAVHREAPDNLLVIVTSDHGNFEDLSVSTHTDNPVPMLVWGPDCRAFAGKIRDLTDVKPAIITYLKEGEPVD